MLTYATCVAFSQFSDLLPHRYLPGVKLPENVVAKPDLIEACQGADLLVFVLPHQVMSKNASLPTPSYSEFGI